MSRVGVLALQGDVREHEHALARAGITLLGRAIGVDGGTLVLAPDLLANVAKADEAVAWIRYQKALTPDRPFFVYFAPGATHAPHHVPQEWIERWKGKFDGGWDNLRHEILARQIELGIVPEGTQLAPMPSMMPACRSPVVCMRPSPRRRSNVSSRYTSITTPISTAIMAPSPPAAAARHVVTSTNEVSSSGSASYGTGSWPIATPTSASRKEGSRSTQSSSRCACTHQ